MNKDYGWVENPQTGEQVNVTTSPQWPVSLKDGLLGFGMLFLGAGYLLVSAFRKGAHASLEGEYNALEKLGLIKGQSKES